MNDPKDTIVIIIEYFDGQTVDDVGYPYYVASSDDLHFVTDGQTFEQLLENIRECLLLSLENIDSVAEYGVLPNAKVKIVMDLPEDYAQTA